MSTEKPVRCSVTPSVRVETNVPQDVGRDVSSELPEEGREGSECSFSGVRVPQVRVLGVCRGLSTDPKHMQEQEGSWLSAHSVYVWQHVPGPPGTGTVEVGGAFPSSPTSSPPIALFLFICFPGGSDGREFACNAGDPSSIHGWGRSPGEGNGSPLQYSCLGNPRTEGPGGLLSWGCKD